MSLADRGRLSNRQRPSRSDWGDAAWTRPAGFKSYGRAKSSIDTSWLAGPLSWRDAFFRMVRVGRRSARSLLPGGAWRFVWGVSFVLEFVGTVGCVSVCMGECFTGEGVRWVMQLEGRGMDTSAGGRLLSALESRLPVWAVRPVWGGPWSTA